MTTRALKLKSETEAAVGSAATEHVETDVRVGYSLSDTYTGSVRVVVESSATEHAGQAIGMAVYHVAGNDAEQIQKVLQSI